jgi:hypothetical protein
LLLLLAPPALLAIPARAGPADYVEVAPSEETIARLREESRPATALDRWHDRLYLATQNVIARLDARFIEADETPLAVPASPFRIGMESAAIWREDGSIDWIGRADVDVLLHLPNLQKRLHIFITSDNVEESPGILRGASNGLRAGIRLTPLRYFDFDLGVRADLPPVAFTSLRWQRHLKWSDWELHPLTKIYLETRRGFGVAAGASIDRWMNLWVVRSSSYANWRHRTADTELTQSITIARAREVIRFRDYSDMEAGHDLARGFGLQLRATGTHDTGVQRYEASFFIKQPTRARWLYWHIAPLVTWERRFGWHPDPGIRLGLDALFWDVSDR